MRHLGQKFCMFPLPVSHLTYYRIFSFLSALMNNGIKFFSFLIFDYSRLIYSVVPPAIAEDLRCKRTIPSLRYDDVTLMFSSVDGFAAFSSTHHPIEIVRFLNRLYTMFDAILDPRVHPKVYKVGCVNGPTSPETSDRWLLPQSCLCLVGRNHYGQLHRGQWMSGRSGGPRLSHSEPGARSSR